MDESPEDVLRRIEEAANEGRHTDAFDIMRADLIKQVLEWFKEAGVVFVRSGPQMPTEFIVGLAMAAHKAIEELGEPSSAKLEVGAMVLDAVAHLRTALAREAPSAAEAPNRLAEVLMHAGALGSASTMVALVRLGQFEMLDELEADRDRRRAGAEKTNRKRATVKETALAAAITVLGTNPTLGADEAAPKIRDKANLSVSLRTVADWVREWRRDGTITSSTTSSREA